MISGPSSDIHRSERAVAGIYPDLLLCDFNQGTKIIEKESLH